MKSAAFIDAMAHVFDVQHKTMVTYTRFLKEAGLLTTGARGVNAPHMTPLDAARVTIALLASDAPGQAVARVKRFGPIPYSATFEKSWPWYENIGKERFDAIFEGETLEEVLAFMFGRVGALGIKEASTWFQENVFHLRVNDFNVLAELVSWKTEDGKPVGEIVVPFQGDPWDKSAHSGITGHIRATREAVGLKFFEISYHLADGANPYPGFDSGGYPIWGRD
ncbi:MAG: hypothetical protein CML03_12665 [Pseudooceanicola sp.]|nr:hypothetical protein [Pseudooceanicola sp.]